MEKIFQALVQNTDEGHWDVMFVGTEEECDTFLLDYMINEENDGTWIATRVEEVKITEREMRIVKMALSEYYINLVSYSDEFNRYIKEEKELINKIERLNK